MKDLLTPSELIAQVRGLYVRGILTEAERGKALGRLAKKYGTRLSDRADAPATRVLALVIRLNSDPPRYWNQVEAGFVLRPGPLESDWRDTWRPDQVAGVREWAKRVGGRVVRIMERK